MKTDEMNVGDFVKVLDRNVQDYGIIIDIVQDGFMICHIIVMMFGGSEKLFHPSRVKVIPKHI